MRVVVLLACLGVALASELMTPARELATTFDSRDPVARTWGRLFALDTHWLGFDLSQIRMAKVLGVRQLLCSRLIYEGLPWSDHRGTVERELSAADREHWALRSRVVEQAILRELRYLPGPDLVPVYTAYLESRPRGAQTTVSALINVVHEDQVVAGQLLGRLVDPRHPAALPGAADPLVRAAGLRLALDWRDDLPAVVSAGMEYALLHADGMPRRAAAALVATYDPVPDLVSPAIIRLLDGGKEQPFSVADQSSLVGLLAVIREVDTGLRERLTEQLLQAERALALAVAQVLLRLQVALPAERAAAIRARAAAATDVAMRHALLAVLAEVDADVLRAEAGPGNPWTALSLHRERIRAAFPPIQEVDDK